MHQKKLVRLRLSSLIGRRCRGHKNKTIFCLKIQSNIDSFFRKRDVSDFVDTEDDVFSAEEEFNDSASYHHTNPASYQNSSSTEKSKSRPVII
jgi:hypothetical protein